MTIAPVSSFLQELESIRTELTQLRTSPGRGLRTTRPTNEFEAFRDAVPSLTHPGRVRKLTKFFGDEPPLLRIFLKKMGYEVGVDCRDASGVVWNSCVCVLNETPPVSLMHSSTYARCFSNTRLRCSGQAR